MPGTAPSAAYKALAPEVSSILSNFLCDLWRPGALRIPQLWSTSYLCFLPKPGKLAKQPDCYRPIALMSASGKAVLKCIRVQLQAPFSAAMAVTPQYAFTPGRSASEAIARAASHCYRVRAMCDSQKQTIHDKHAGADRFPCCGGAQLAVDLSKAFDSLPRFILEQVLIHAGVQADLRELILLWHEQGIYKIEARGDPHQETIGTGQGVRQGCVLSPALWALFTAYFIPRLEAKTRPGWPQQALTLYADDHLFRWTFTTAAQLRELKHDIQAIFETLRELGMQPNPAKSSLILRIAGKEAANWKRKAISVTKNGARVLRYGGQLADVIPIVPRYTYLGVVLSFEHFELDTMRHRLSQASAHHGRLRRMIHAYKSLTAKQRFELWRTCIQSAQLYGLEAVGVNASGLRLLHIQTIKHLRGIFRTPRHLALPSDTSFMEHFHITDPQEVLRGRCQAFGQRLRAQHDIPCYGVQEIREWADQVLDRVPAPYQSATRAAPSVDMPYKCTHCDLCFQDLRVLKSHEGKAHKVHAQVLSVDKGMHGVNGLPVCRHCEVKFATWHCLKRHIPSKAVRGLGRRRMPIPCLPRALPPPLRRLSPSPNHCCRTCRTYSALPPGL